ncbi:MAG: tetratricopeptide repeat protein [Lentisphaerae bacterium]|nr:tetratricopeptide repeat protein [Lentisphaerota bacterium]
MRILYLIELPDNPDYSSPAIDAAFHDTWAYAMVSGDMDIPDDCREAIFSANPYFRPPGYPYFLATVYRLFGSDCLAPRAVQMFLGLLSAVLVYLISLRLASRISALFSGLIAATFWTFIYYEGELLENSLLIFLLLACWYVLLLWLESPGTGRSLVAGLFAGYATIVRPNIMLFGILLPIWQIVIFYRTRHKSNAKIKWRPIFLNILAVCLGLFLPISLTTVRNAVVSKQFVPVSANAGINLYIGNHEEANGTFVTPSAIGRFADCCDYPALVRSLERETGGPVNYSQASQIFSQRAIVFMKENPLRTFSLILKKTYLFWVPFEIPHNKVEQYEKLNSGILRLLPFSFSFILAVAIFGIIFVFSKRLKLGETEDSLKTGIAGFLALFIISYFASYLPFFVTGQYRTAIIPAMIILMAPVPDRIHGWYKDQDLSRLLLFALLWLIVFVLLSLNFSDISLDASRWHFDRGVAYERIEEPDNAISEYTHALSINPQHEKAKLNRANILFENGLANQAMSDYLDVIKANPRAAGAFANLGRLLYEHKHYTEARNAFLRSIEIAPDEPMFLLNLAILLEDPECEEFYDPDQGKRLRAKAEYLRTGY